jgi:serine protease Do
MNIPQSCTRPRRHRAGPGLTRLLAALLAAVGLALGGALAQAKAAPQKPVSVAAAAGLDLLVQESKARAAIVKEVGPAVVNVMVEKKVKSDGPAEMPEPFNDEFFRRFFQPRLPFQQREFRQRGLGSGTIVDSRGYILTNNHVVADADKITVKLPDGRQFDGKLVGADPATDIAVVRIKATQLPLARLGDSSAMDVGESVIAIGNPFGLEQTVTAGIVSAKGRSQVGVADYEDFIQTDASINPGNSGGPLINLKGEVVGVNTAIFSRSGGSVGIGFAIPINEARDIMTSLIDTGKVTRGFLGVVIQELTPELASSLNVQPGEGVLVATVGPKTPAAAAGIKQGDILQSFNGQAVKSVTGLRAAVARAKPGATVAAELLRDGKRVTLSVTLKEQPHDMHASLAPAAPGDEGGSAAPGTESVLGMTLQALTPPLAEQLGYQGKEGVVVTDVEADSPAADAGLQQGAIILAVNRHPVKAPAEVVEQVKQTPAGKATLLLARLGQADRYIALSSKH